MAGVPARPVTQRSAASAAEEQPLARAVEHQHLGGRIDRPRQVEAAAQPARDRRAKLVDTLIHRVLAELRDVRGQHWANERRHRMLRLADRKADGRLAGRRIAEQLAQAHERRAALVGPGGSGEAFGVAHHID